MEDRYFVSIANNIFKTRRTINTVGFSYDGEVKHCTKHCSRKLKVPIIIHRTNPELVLWNDKPSNFEHIYTKKEIEYGILPNMISEYNQLIKQQVMGKTFKDKKNFFCNFSSFFL